MSEFKVGDRIKYVGKCTSYHSEKDIGRSGTVIADGGSGQRSEHGPMSANPGNASAFHGGSTNGLTKRELFALEIFKAYTIKDIDPCYGTEDKIQWALDDADELLQALNP